MAGKAVAAAARDYPEGFACAYEAAGHLVDSAVTAHGNDNVLHGIMGKIYGITGKTGVCNLAAALLQTPDYPPLLAFAARNGIHYVKNRTLHLMKSGLRNQVPVLQRFT